MKPTRILGATLGACVHVAGIRNFLDLCESRAAGPRFSARRSDPRLSSTRARGPAGHRGRELPADAGGGGTSFSRAEGRDRAPGIDRSPFRLRGDASGRGGRRTVRDLRARFLGRSPSMKSSLLRGGRTEEAPEDLSGRPQIPDPMETPGPVDRHHYGRPTLGGNPGRRPGDRGVLCFGRSFPGSRPERSGKLLPSGRNGSWVRTGRGGSAPGRPNPTKP